MMRLPRHRAEVRHLPEQPFIHFNALALVSGIEFSGLASEILQDRARLKDGNGFAVWPRRIDNRRHPIVRRDFEKIGLELIAPLDVHKIDVVRQPAFLEHDRDFPAVGCRPVIKFDRPLLGSCRFA